MSDYRIEMQISNENQSVCFDNFPLENCRAPYEIELLPIGNEARTPECHSSTAVEKAIESCLLEFVKSGDSALLCKHELVLVESPGVSEISRNITLVHPKSNSMYVIGGIGLVRFDSKRKVLTLNDPLLDREYGEYQRKHGRNPGGVIYVSDEGVEDEDNATPLGVSYATKGPYSLISKIEKTKNVARSGIRTPRYLCAGRITNLDKGEWGFSIYTTPLQPDYRRNLRLYLDSTANFKPVFIEYLSRKYAALWELHSGLGYSHGQPTIENAGAILVFDDQGIVHGDCILKDMDTLKPLPKSMNKSIVEGPCPQRIGINIRKSPHVAAQTYDLQLAVTQELNILLIASQQLPSLDVKFQFLKYQLSVMFTEICKAYRIVDAKQAPEILEFCLTYFVGAVQRGLKFDAFTEVLGGLFANAVFGFSAQYKDQIEVIPE